MTHVAVAVHLFSKVGKENFFHYHVAQKPLKGLTWRDVYCKLFLAQIYFVKW